MRGKGDPDTGEFETYEILSAGMAPQPPLPSPGTNHFFETSYFLDTVQNTYVLLISGVNLGADGINPLHFQLLVEHVTGRSGSSRVLAPCDFFQFFRSMYYRRIYRELYLQETLFALLKKTYFRTTAWYCSFFFWTYLGRGLLRKIKII